MDRKSQIMREAVRLFAEKGYHATSIADLSNAVGLGRGALYYYIKCKEDLLWQAHNDHVDPLIAFGQEIADRDCSATEKLQAVSNRMLKTIAEYRDYIVVFYREMNALPPDRMQEVIAKRNAFEACILQIIQAGIDRGEFAPVDGRMAVLAFLGMHNWTYTWFSPQGRLSGAQVAEQFSQIFLKGIQTSTDRKGSEDGVARH